MTRQPDPPDEAALRALAEALVEAEVAVDAAHDALHTHPHEPDAGLRYEATWLAYQNARDAYKAAATPQAVLATLADLRARLAAAERRESNLQFLVRYIVDGVAKATGVAYDEPSDVVDCVRNLLADAEASRARLAAVEGERDALLQAVKNMRLAAAMGLSYGQQATLHTPDRIAEYRVGKLTNIVKVCASVGVTGTVLRAMDGELGDE